MNTVPRTLAEALQQRKLESERGFTFLDRKLAPEAWSFTALVEEAERRGTALLQNGLRRGDRLALILPEGRDFVLSFLGAVLAGIVPVPMYPPVSMSRASAYLETTRGILQSSGARYLLTTAEARTFAAPLVGGDAPLEGVMAVEQLARDAEGLAPALGPAPSPEDPCFLQYTSGSTSAPKGVLVTHANVAANGLAIMHGLDSDPRRDRGLSWLPLYHDMGLVGFVLAPLMVGVPVVFVPTVAFVKQPNLWFELVHEYRATITFGPNFAFGLCSKRAKHDRVLDLSCLRVLGCGAEPINPQTIRGFLDHYRAHGLHPNALIACYGMAEATLAITFERLDEPFRTVRVARRDYAEQRRARLVEDGSGVPAIELPSCGRPFPGHTLRIADAAGEPLGEDAVGEVLVRGPSVSAGYFGAAAASGELLRDGWLHTGDLGFLHDGRLYVSGRKKDLIIVNGRNYYPQSIEWVVEHVEGVRAGTAVAFACARDDGECAIVVAEAAAGASPERLRDEIQRRVAQSLGIALGDVAIVRQGTVPRTTSGKVQRSKTRALFESGALRVLERADAPRAAVSIA